MELVANEISETLEAQVKARVPTEQREAVDRLVLERRKSGARISRGDILREALTEYFERRTPNHPLSLKKKKPTQAGGHASTR
jgi:hypothetical protein